MIIILTAKTKKININTWYFERKAAVIARFKVNRLHPGVILSMINPPGTGSSDPDKSRSSWNLECWYLWRAGNLKPRNRCQDTMVTKSFCQCSTLAPRRRANDTNWWNLNQRLLSSMSLSAFSEHPSWGILLVMKANFNVYYYERLLLSMSFSLQF